MNTVPEQTKNEFITYAHKFAEAGLVRGGSGNLSCRISSELMIITTTGSWLSELTEDAVALCTMQNGAGQSNGKQPSMELKLHRSVLCKRPDINIVLHCQSPYATALACAEKNDFNYSVIPEIPYYIGAVKTIPYYDPGSDELSLAISESVAYHDLLVLKNHGQVITGRTFREVHERALFFEFACEIILFNNNRVQSLSFNAVEYLKLARKKSIKKI